MACPGPVDRARDALSGAIASAKRPACSRARPSSVCAMQKLGSSRGTIRAAARSLPPDLAAVAAGAADRLAPPLRGGTVYTDDRAPVEWLIDSSIVKVAAEGER